MLMKSRLLSCSIATFEVTTGICGNKMLNSVGFLFSNISLLIFIPEYSGCIEGLHFQHASDRRIKLLATAATPKKHSESWQQSGAALVQEKGIFGWDA